MNTIFARIFSISLNFLHIVAIVAFTLLFINGGAMLGGQLFVLLAALGYFLVAGLASVVLAIFDNVEEMTDIARTNRAKMNSQTKSDE